MDDDQMMSIILIMLAFIMLALSAKASEIPIVGPIGESEEERCSAMKKTKSELEQELVNIRKDLRECGILIEVPETCNSVRDSL